MEELLLFFERRAGLTTEEFGRHYLDVHAPMATAWVRVIGRYVVNLPAVPDPYDAVTEVWVDSLDAFQDPTQAFADRDHARAMARDHHSFIGAMHGYRVQRSAAWGDLGGGDGGRRTVDGHPAAKVLLATWAAPGDLADARTVDPPALGAPADAGPERRLVVRRALGAFTPDAPPLVHAQEVTCRSADELAPWVERAQRIAASPAPGLAHTVHVLTEHVQRAAPTAR